MELNEAIEKRRSYRSLDKISISDKDIEELASAAGMAPSCYNKQPWRYVFVREEDSLGGVKEALADGNRWAKEASLIIAVISKPELDCVMDDGREYYTFDTGLSVSIMLLKAVEKGLTAHCIAGYDQEKVKSALAIPADMEVITLVIVGKHSQDIKPYLSEKMKDAEKERPPRKSIKETTYLDRYSNG